MDKRKKFNSVNRVQNKKTKSNWRISTVKYLIDWVIQKIDRYLIFNT